MFGKIYEIGINVVAWVTPVILAMKLFYAANKSKIDAIILRIQKDLADKKWTKQEKEDTAVMIFMNLFYLKIPKPVRMVIGKKNVEKIVRYIIRKTCGKSHEMKGAIKGVININTDSSV